MEIRINDTVLDFTLENEKNLGEVIDQIDLWLQGSNLVLTSIAFDDKELLSLPSPEWRDIPVEKVITLKLAAKPDHEILATNMETILEFLSLLQNALENHDIKLLEELQGGFSVMTESVKKHLPASPKTELPLIELSKLINSISWEKTEVNQALHLIKQLAETCRQSVKEFYTELNAVLKELVEAFHSQDSVLIGDLQEYEIAPRLESIKTLGQDLS